MLQAVKSIDASLIAMSNAMLKVGGSATIMGNQTAAAMNKVTLAAKLSAYEMRNAVLAQPNRMFVAGSSGTSIAPLPAVIKAPAVTPIVNEKPAVAALGRMNTALAMTAQRFRTFGYLASITLTAPIVLLSKTIIQLGKDYEYTMQKIVGITSATQKMTDDWSKSILRLAPQLGKGPKELAEGMYFVASAGFKGVEAIDVLTLSAKAAEAGLGETKDITQFLTSALNAYARTGLTAAKATDILVAGVNYGKIEAREFANAIGSVIPIASAMGVSLGQVVGTMAAMTLQGASASNAAVYLKGILNSILKIKPENQAGKALAELGSSAIELRNMLASGPNGVMDVLLKIQEWAKTNPYILNKVFGNIRSLTGDLSLMGNHLKDNQKVINLVVNAFGDLDVAVSAVSDTLKVRMDKAMAGLQSGVIKFGDTISKYIMPIIEGFVKLLNKLMSWFTNLSEPMKKVVLGLVAIAAAVGPLSLLLSLHMYIINGLTLAYGQLKLAMFPISSITLVWVGVILAAAVAVGVLVAAIIHLTKTQQPLAKMYQNMNAELVKEQISLDSVFKRLKDANTGTKERAEAIKIVNSRYGEYLSRLLTEKSSLEDITRAQNEATKALQHNIAIKFYGEEIEKQKASMIDAVNKNFKNIMSGWTNQFGADQLGAFISGLNKALDDATAKGVSRNKQFDILTSFYKKFVKDLGGENINTLNIDKFGKAWFNVIPIWREARKELVILESAYEEASKTKLTADQVGAKMAVLGPIFAQAGAISGNIAFKALGMTMTLFAQTLGFVTSGWNDLTDAEDKATNFTEELGLTWQKAGNLINDAARLIKNGMNEDFWRMLTPPKKENALKDYLGTGQLERNKQGGFNIPGYSLDNVNPSKYMPSIKGEYTETAAVMNKLGAELEYVNMKEKALGITMGKRKPLFDSARERMNAYSEALEDYLAIPLTERGDAWQKLVDDTIDGLERIQKEYDKIQARRDFMNGIRDSMTVFFTETMMNFKDFGSALQSFVKSIEHAFAKLIAENLANKLMEVLMPEGGGKIFSIIDNILGLNKAITASKAAAIPITTAAAAADAAAVPAAIALTAAKSGEAIAGATASGAKMPFPVNLIAIALGIAAVIGALALTKRSKMAEGGTVPSGFPNDTYPALLTSGETVIPNKFNPSDFTRGKIDFEPVEFVIKENQLVGILRKANTRKQLT
jgi:TP901 family phage tail tape measure protein